MPARPLLYTNTTKAPMSPLCNKQLRITNRLQAGFTLIELMAVVAILGILASLAMGSYTQHLKASHRTQVIADLSNLGLRQKALFSVRGHYATTVASGDSAKSYPLNPSALKAKDGAPIHWDISSAGYTLSGASDVKYTRGGADEHGFDVLNFVPQNGTSRCAYGSVAGDGTRGRFGDEPASSGIAKRVFPTGTERFFARDWYFSYAYCDFDGDGTPWIFTSEHVTLKVIPGENWGE